MIKRIVKLTFRPEETAAFEAIFAAKKDLISSFPGCKQARLFRDTQNPNIYFTVSIWNSENDLANYRKSDLFKKTWASTKALFAEKAQAWSINDITPE
jgi:heme-degrading monooxygenase HmoA